MRLKKLQFYLLGLFFFGILRSQSQSGFYISDTNGSKDLYINCDYPFANGSCIQLTANYPQYKLTDSYTVSSAVYAPYTAPGKTVIKKNLDDVFTEVIDLPFTFCFYGKSYKSLVIGSNGMISFDANQANQPNAPNFSDSLPNQNLPKASIFGVLQDIFFSTSNDSEINYSVIGNAPFRKFIVNFYKGRLSGCESQTSTSQIVLSEGSNKIEIFVENKEIPCNLAKYKNSLIGISNESGNLGMEAPGRNTGIWAAQNEAWEFSPVGSNIAPDFVWYDGSGNIIGKSKDQIVCPSKDEIFKVDILYTTCIGETITYSDDITIKFAPDYPTAQPYNKIVCNVGEAITLADYKQFLTTNGSSNFNFEFTDADTGQIVDEKIPFSINKDRNFNVTISNKNRPNCNKTTTLKFQFLSENILTNTLEVCDLLNDGVENNYDLSKFDIKLVKNNYKGSISYFLSNDDAVNNNNQITKYNLVNGTQLYVKLSYQSCVNILGPVTISFNKTPTIISPVNINVTLCDINSDGLEDFDWVGAVKDKITTDAGVSLIRVFNTYDEAFNALPYNLGLSKIKEGIYKVFARVEYPGGCFSIAEINMNVVFEAIKLNDSNKYICFDGSQDIAIDLDKLTVGMLIDPLDGSVKGPIYYKTYGDAVINNPNKIISANQLITDNGDFIIKTFFVRFEKAEDCYTIRQVNVHLIHLVKNIDRFYICDNKNDGNETIKLNGYLNQLSRLSGTQNLFFSSEAEAQANVSRTNINSVAINGNAVVYARISLYDCVLIFPVTFTLVNTPRIKTDINAIIKNVCDNNADNIENIDVRVYESQINFNNEDLDFTYYRSYDEQSNTFFNQYSNPASIPISNGDTVYVKVKYRNSECFSSAKMTFNVNFYSPIYLAKNAVLKLCDRDLNFGESFDLSLATSQIFDQSVNTVRLSDLDISYYATEADANAGTVNGKIPSLYPTYVANISVYARFQSKTNGCYSVAPINLLSYFPAKARNSVIQICDNNLDGYYDVNLIDYKDQMVQIPSSENVFTFYLNQDDIGVPGKEIKNPESFILNPYTSKIWVYVENLKDCGSSAEINFINGAKITLAQNKFSTSICDEGNDAKETVNLTTFESNFGNTYTYEYFESNQDMVNSQNKIQNPSAYLFEEAKGISKFYVKVSQSGFCPDFYTVDVQIKKTPIININDFYYCKNDLIGLDIRPNFTGLDVVYYKWEYPDGTISEGADQNFLTGVKKVGTYKLTLTNTLNCTYTAVFKVINIDTPEITSLSGQNDYYVVTAVGTPGRKIVYSMDLVNWQDSNYFGNLQPGDYTFYVRYSDSGCHGDGRRGKIFTIINTITPNGDGLNDRWKLSGLDVFPESSILQIYDKFGSLVYKQISNTEFVWDGKYDSRNLETDSYWYVITAADGRIYKGWILLKNRN